MWIQIKEDEFVYEYEGKHHVAYNLAETNVKRCTWERRKKNRDICIDAWKDTILKDYLGQYTIVDEHVGKEVMKNVGEKTYLGQII